MSVQSSISLVTQIPTALHLSVREYLDTHPDWEQDQVFTEALSQFFLDNQQSLEKLVSLNKFIGSTKEQALETSNKLSKH